MQFYILTDVIITTFIIPEKPWDQLAKDTPSNIFYNILNYILNDTTELNPRLTAFIIILPNCRNSIKF